METCMVKPEEIQKPVKPKPPPKPAQIKGNEPQRLEKAAPAVPTDAAYRNAEERSVSPESPSAGSHSLCESNELTNECLDTELLLRNHVMENKQEKGGGLLSKILRKALRASGQPVRGEKEPSASNELCEVTPAEKSIFTNVFKSVQKPAGGAAADEALKLNQTESDADEDKKLLFSSWENLLEAATSKIKKSPHPAPRSITAEDLSDREQPTSWDGAGLSAGEDLPSHDELSLSDASRPTKTSQDRKVRFAGMFRRTQKPAEQQCTRSEDAEAPEGAELRRSRTIKKKRRVVSFRVRKTLPRTPRFTSSSQTPDRKPIIEENVALQELNLAEQSTVELQPVEMAAFPAENKPVASEPQSEQESDDLMAWWNTVKGWTEWNETSHSQEEDIEEIVEQAADRVYLAARLFVHLFNQQGASLQQRILELLLVADAADQFHKKTVKAAVGGGVASVAGSVATITGLILAPFTFGASVIVTAVGISVATAGSITSATANITDTVHSSMDRKKVEKMIQGYQKEISDIRECLEFVQEGMDALQEWNFEQYCQSASKKALNHSVKHVVKEGGRAGKELMINTSTLISTVQLLGATGGAVKAAQVISITTGVMSALFLALDVFFLAKDSHELRKGAKTQFAAKIREVCRDLQHGLLELNKVKAELQKTMDGIEVEEYEEIEEVEVEIEDDVEKLAELEQELDLLEEKLDKKGEEEQKKSKETEKENLQRKDKKEKSVKEKGDPEIEKELPREKHAKKGREKGKGKVEETKSKKEKGKVEEKKSKKEKGKVKEKKSKKEKLELKGKLKPKSENIPDVDKEKKREESLKTEDLEERSKETKDHKEPRESKQDKEDTGTDGKTHEENEVDEKEIKRRSGDSEKEDRCKELNSERVNTDREHHRKIRDIRVIKPEWKPVNKEVESVGMNMHGSGSRTEYSDPQRQHWRPTATQDHQRERGGEEQRGKRVENVTSKFETEAGMEMEMGRRQENGERRRRDREREQRCRADGLYI